MHLRRTSLWTLLLLLVMLASACATPAAPAAPAAESGDEAAATGPKVGGTLNVSLGDDFVTFHPFIDATNIEIKPVFGVDFAIPETIVADADPEDVEEVVARPPSLKPAAARKLLDLADRLGATLERNIPRTTASAPAAASNEL